MTNKFFFLFLFLSQVYEKLRLDTNHLWCPACEDWFLIWEPCCLLPEPEPEPEPELDDSSSSESAEDESRDTFVAYFPQDTLIRRINTYDFPYEFGPREAVLPVDIEDLMPADFEDGLDDID